MRELSTTIVQKTTNLLRYDVVSGAKMRLKSKRSFAIASL